VEKLVLLVEAQEEWLMGRILEYSKLHGYVKYTSTLKEAWRQSIAGLNKALSLAYEAGEGISELGAQETYLGDPITDFAVLEARRHRERGVNLAMFLGLFKFYRQCYLDLVAESEFNGDEQHDLNLHLRRFFDRIEIAFCSEWANEDQGDRYKEMRLANLRLTSEKNKYLTIFASLSEPVFLFGSDNCLEDFNHAASAFLGREDVPGAHYYGKDRSQEQKQGKPQHRARISEFLPWLSDDFEDFSKSEEDVLSILKFVGPKIYEVSLARMLDVSGKFSGVVVILYDMTDEQEASARKEERDKLQAAIETAGAVCHELSQPMQALLMRAEIANLKAADIPEVREELEKIMEQITIMGEITHRLLSLTKYKTKHYMDGTEILDLA
jgi:PAS domain-containing protein